MKKYIGLLLLGLSLLTTAIIISLGQISLAIKEVATGKYSFTSASGEISIISYLLVFVAILISILLIKNSKNN